MNQTQLYQWCSVNQRYQALEQQRRTRELLERQLEESRVAASRAKRDADASAEYARTTLQEILDYETLRLEVEKTRAQAEADERKLRQQEQNDLKEIRRFMADSIAFFEELQSQSATSDALTRAVALIHARVKALERMENALVDLSDMQVLRKLKSDVRAFTQHKATAGLILADPLSSAQTELQELRSLLASFESCRADMIQLTSVWPVKKRNARKKQTALPSLADLETMRACFQVGLNEMPIRLEQLRNQITPEHWTSDGDVRPDLLAIAVLLGEDANLVARGRELYDFVHARGNLHADLCERFVQVEDQHKELESLHEQHMVIVSEANEILGKGNHATARQRIEDLQDRFADVNYDAITAACREWEDWFRWCDQAQKPLTSVLTLYLRDYISPFTALAQLKQSRSACEEFRNTLIELKRVEDSYPQSEAAATAKSYATSWNLLPTSQKRITGSA